MIALAQIGDTVGRIEASDRATRRRNDARERPPAGLGHHSYAPAVARRAKRGDFHQFARVTVVCGLRPLVRDLASVGVLDGGRPASLGAMAGSHAHDAGWRQCRVAGKDRTTRRRRKMIAGTGTRRERASAAAPNRLALRHCGTVISSSRCRSAVRKYTPLPPPQWLSFLSSALQGALP